MSLPQFVIIVIIIVFYMLFLYVAVFFIRESTQTFFISNFNVQSKQHTGHRGLIITLRVFGGSTDHIKHLYGD